MSEVAEDVKKAFEEIEKSDLKVDTIVCSECGCVLSTQLKDSKPCEHLIKMVQEWNE